MSEISMGPKERKMEVMLKANYSEIAEREREKVSSLTSYIGVRRIAKEIASLRQC